jgi:hypothetical protein
MTASAEFAAGGSATGIFTPAWARKKLEAIERFCPHGAINTTGKRGPGLKTVKSLATARNQAWHDSCE